jgi:hypothetical protein
MCFLRITVPAALTLSIAGSFPTLQAQGAQVHEKTAAEMYKNVQVLKDVPVSDWIPTMEFISGSLGVSCELCHTIGQFDSDSKSPKRTARSMIRMVKAINDDNFGGQLAVTCNTCHQGMVKPNPVPAPWDKSAAQLAAYQAELQAQASTDRGEPIPAAAPVTPDPRLPTPTQIIARYSEAVGVPAFKTWMSLRISGSVSAQAAKGAFNYTVYVLPAGQVLFGDSVQGASPRIFLSGARAWMATATGRTPVAADQIDNLHARARLFGPVKVAESPAMRTTGADTIDRRKVYVIESREPKVVRRFSFDAESGLLSRMRENIATPLGTMVNETNYDDYRDVDGVKIPFAITVLYMEDKFRYALTDVRKNAAIDTTQFVPDGAPPATIR